MTSLFRTKNGASPFPRIFSASLSGPAVPSGSVSTLNSMRTLYSASYCGEYVSVDRGKTLANPYTFFSAAVIISGR